MIAANVPVVSETQTGFALNFLSVVGDDITWKISLLPKKEECLEHQRLQMKMWSRGWCLYVCVSVCLRWAVICPSVRPVKSCHTYFIRWQWYFHSFVVLVCGCLSLVVYASVNYNMLLLLLVRPLTHCNLQLQSFIPRGSHNVSWHYEIYEWALQSPLWLDNDIMTPAVSPCLISDLFLKSPPKCEGPFLFMCVYVFACAWMPSSYIAGAIHASFAVSILRPTGQMALSNMCICLICTFTCKSVLATPHKLPLSRVLCSCTRGAAITVLYIVSSITRCCTHLSDVPHCLFTPLSAMLLSCGDTASGSLCDVLVFLRAWVSPLLCLPLPSTMSLSLFLSVLSSLPLFLSFSPFGVEKLWHYGGCLTTDLNCSFTLPALVFLCSSFAEGVCGETPLETMSGSISALRGHSWFHTEISDRYWDFLFPLCKDTCLLRHTQPRLEGFKVSTAGSWLCVNKAKLCSLIQVSSQIC